MSPSPATWCPSCRAASPSGWSWGALSADDFVRILTEPHNALIRQYEELMKTEGLTLNFTPEAIRELANIASQVNQATENIGARRLHTVMERLLEEVSFEAPSMDGVTLNIDAEYVKQRLADISTDRDLSRYIL